MNAKPKTELNRCVLDQKRNSVNGALVNKDKRNDVKTEDCHRTTCISNVLPHQIVQA